MKNLLSKVGQFLLCLLFCAVVGYVAVMWVLPELLKGLQH